MESDYRITVLRGDHIAVNEWASLFGIADNKFLEVPEGQRRNTGKGSVRCHTVHIVIHDDGITVQPWRRAERGVAFLECVLPQTLLITGDAGLQLAEIFDCWL